MRAASTTVAVFMSSGRSAASMNVRSSSTGQRQALRPAPRAAACCATPACLEVAPALLRGGADRLASAAHRFLLCCFFWLCGDCTPASCLKVAPARGLSDVLRGDGATGGAPAH